MADSNTGRPGQFKKGADPRRHLYGQTSQKVLAFNKTLRELIVTEGERKHTDADGKVTLKKVDWLVKVLWNQALKGEHWAMEFIADRVEGKVTQALEHTGAAGEPIQVILQPARGKDDGNGNGGEASK